MVKADGLITAGSDIDVLAFQCIPAVILAGFPDRFPYPDYRLDSLPVIPFSINVRLWEHTPQSLWKAACGQFFPGIITQPGRKYAARLPSKPSPKPRPRYHPRNS